MSRNIDYKNAEQKLKELYIDAEQLYYLKNAPNVSDLFSKACDRLFESRTQSFREVALGCGLVRLLDKTANLRLPYANQGEFAYNGRTLDEKVINPFLHDRQIPASKGPYLATFRRSVRFVHGTSSGMRDKKGYDAFLDVITIFENSTEDAQISEHIKYILYRFIALRDEANIALAHIARLNLNQYNILFTQLLDTPSGGLLPVLLTVSMLKAIQKCFNLDWTIEWQGINVSDRASGAGGDITVRRKDKLHFSIEITERLIDRSRVVSTFNTKITPHGITDYLFFFTINQPSEDAIKYAEALFNQGHEVNFIEIKPWLVNNLVTLGGSCRSVFTEEFLYLLGNKETPSTLKVVWNDLVNQLIE